MMITIQQTELNKTQLSKEASIVTRGHIDVEKWDTCIRNSVNESPLAYTWVLDCLTPGWKALIFGDYKGVMPLPTANTLALNLIQMPFDVQNLGIYSTDASIASLGPEIFEMPCFKTFHFISYSFMPMAKHNPGNDPIKPFRNTFELSLNKDYETLRNNYSKSHKKNLTRFARHNLTIEKNKHPEAYKLLQQKKAEDKTMLFTPDFHNRNFNNMVKEALKKRKGEIYTVSQDSQIRGAAFYLSGSKRTIVFHISDSAGREMKTTFGLIDHFINQNAGTETILDFAGSDIENIADFNRGFGAAQKYYLTANIDHLPLLFNLVKKANIRFRLVRFIHQIKKKVLKERKIEPHI